MLDVNKEVVEALIKELDQCVESGRSTRDGKQKNYEPEYPWVQINWR